MILIVGPLYSGKRSYACRLLHCTRAELDARAACEVQNLAADAADLEALADELAAREVVTATEVGGGIVPTDPAERAARETAGRLNCLLAARADAVVRVYCGLPQILKGTLPKC